MKLCKFCCVTSELQVGQLVDDRLFPLKLSGGQYRTLSDILEADDPWEVADFLVDRRRALGADEVIWKPPIDRQEVWAAGVTYRRSQTARMEESRAASSFYDRVYTARRPELFFKATPHRVMGPGEPVRVRGDSRASVPEPELTLVLASDLRLVGYTVGNDLTARDIEGQNPLYLPQAKVYDGSCALGPCIALTGSMPPLSTVQIRMEIHRGATQVFAGATDLGQLARTFDELIAWLGRDNSFPQGVFLLTGTGIVPDQDVALMPGDRVAITIDGIGMLENPVVQG